MKIVSESLLEFFKPQSIKSNLGLGKIGEIQKEMKDLDLSPGSLENMLIWCIENYKDENYIRTLLDDGANIHYNDDYPLIVAIQNKNIKAVKALLDYGLNFKNVDKRFMFLAISNGAYSIFKLLLKSSEDINNKQLINFIISKDSLESFLILNNNLNIHMDNDYIIKLAVVKDSWNILNFILKKYKFPNNLLFNLIFESLKFHELPSLGVLSNYANTQLNYKDKYNLIVYCLNNNLYKPLNILLMSGFYDVLKDNKIINWAKEYDIKAYNILKNYDK